MKGALFKVLSLLAVLACVVTSAYAGSPHGSHFLRKRISSKAEHQKAKRVALVQQAQEPDLSSDPNDPDCNLNVYFLIDLSGSINQADEIEKVATGAQALVTEALNRGARVTVSFFSGTPEVGASGAGTLDYITNHREDHAGAAAMGARVAGDVRKALGATTRDRTTQMGRVAGYYTDIIDGFNEVYANTLKSPDKRFPSLVYVLTDGEPTWSPKHPVHPHVNGRLQYQMPDQIAKSHFSDMFGKAADRAAEARGEAKTKLVMVLFGDGAAGVRRVKPSDAKAKEAFDKFCTEGCTAMPSKDLGEALRACELVPSEAYLKETIEELGETIEYAAFHKLMPGHLERFFQDHTRASGYIDVGHDMQTDDLLAALDVGDCKKSRYATVYFKNGLDTLYDYQEDQAEIGNRLTEFLADKDPACTKSDPARLYVAAYASKKSSQKSNQALSERRALHGACALHAHMQKTTCKEYCIATKGFGETKAKALVTAAHDDAKLDRKIEIYFTEELKPEYATTDGALLYETSAPSFAKWSADCDANFTDWSTVYWLEFTYSAP